MADAIAALTNAAASAADKPADERAQPAQPAGLTLRKIEFKQDQWENVPSLVYKAFVLQSQNMNAIQKWSAKVDERARDAVMMDQRLQDRIDSLCRELDTARSESATQAEEFRETTSRLRTQSDACASCLRQLLRTTTIFLKRFVGVYGAQIDVDTSDLPGMSSPSPEMAVAQEERETEHDAVVSPRRASRGHRSFYVSPTKTPLGEDDSPVRRDSVRLSSKGANWAELETAQRVAEELRTLGNAVEDQTDAISEAFEVWLCRRTTDSKDKRELVDRVDSIQVASEHARQRLLSWRELLKESTKSTESLTETLAEAQEQIKELRDCQMVREDVDAVVGEAAAKLEILHEATQHRIADISTRMEIHAANLDGHAKDSRRETREHVEEHSKKIADLLERSLTPISSYLNAMHVKADAVRVDLDAVRLQLPGVSSRVEEVDVELKAHSGKTQEHHLELGASLDSLRGATESIEANASERCDALAGSIFEIGERIDAEVGNMTGTLEGTTQEVDMMRRLDIGSLRKDLQGLEQKVAKWIYAEPLPSKLSEARLYSLEARLAEETDSRLLLEEQVKTSGGGLAPFSMRGDSRILAGGSLNLPKLAKSSDRRQLKDGSVTDRGSYPEPPKRRSKDPKDYTQSLQQVLA